MNARVLLVLVALVVVGWQVDRRAQRRAGFQQGVAQEAAKRVQRAESIVRITDTVYSRDTVRLNRVLTRYDSVRTTDTLTVVRNDTVKVYVSRDVADSAVSLCRLTVFSCEARVAARDSVVRGLRAQLQAVKASEPSWVAVWSERGLWALIGAALDAVFRR